jgi:hypothetical protein
MIPIQVVRQTILIAREPVEEALCRIHGVVAVKVSIYLVTAVLAMVKFRKTAQETAVEMLSLINAAPVTQTPITTVHRIVRMNGEALQV